jgi:hypothetical protein
MKYDFTDKATYLAWRAKWKADYKELSLNIRRAKRTRKEFVRHYETVETAQGKARVLVSKEPNPYANDWPTGFYLDRGQANATFMLEQLQEAKALSWSMKQAAAKAPQAA